MNSLRVHLSWITPDTAAQEKNLPKYNVNDSKFGFPWMTLWPSAALNQSGWTFLIWNPSYSAGHGHRHIFEISLPLMFMSGDRWPCPKLLQHLFKVYQADLRRRRGMGHRETANPNILTMGTHQKYFDTTPWPFHHPQPNLSDFSGTVRIILWLTQWAAPVNHVSRRFWDLLTNLVAIAASSAARCFFIPSESDRPCTLKDWPGIP